MSTIGRFITFRIANKVLSKPEVATGRTGQTEPTFTRSTT